MATLSDRPKMYLALSVGGYEEQEERMHNRIQIFCQPKKLKSLKIMTYQSCKAIRLNRFIALWILKITYMLMTSNVQNGILLKRNCDTKILCHAMFTLRSPYPPLPETLFMV